MNTKNKLILAWVATIVAALVVIYSLCNIVIIIINNI